MADKKEAAPPPAAPAPEAAPDGGKPAKAPSPIVPILAAVVLAPALSWAVTNFVMMPQLKKQLAEHASAAPEGGAPADAHAAPAAEAGGGGHGGGQGEKKGEAAGPGNTYQFENVVVNLAGTMGTRYLKTSFMVSGKDQGLRAAFENNKAKLIDTTLNTLSSLSLPDLEEVGSRNMIREKLLAAYNQVLGKRMVEQIYFSDFVVQ